MAESAIDKSNHQELAFFSYGFRPFFLGAALFAGVAVPAWILILVGAGDSTFFYAPRDWHVHEMVFGFLPAVITGFLLTAIPNWTERSPIKGIPLMLVFGLWVAGRVVIAIPWFPPLPSAIVDGAFLVVVAGIVWREIAAGKAWDRLPMGVLISLYAGANILFHVLGQNDGASDLAVRLALALVMVLLTLIGGRITPSFTGDFLVEEGKSQQPPSFSKVDGLSIVLVGIAAVAWVVQPQAMATGLTFVVAGLANVFRLVRWYGWLTWREPLVLILHLGYGWLGMSMLILGGAIGGFSMATEDAIHALTTGAVGVMTLAVMTRASLGHTGRIKHAGPMTVLIYILVNLGALLRVFGSYTDLPTNIVLSLATVSWSGAYILFAVVYGPILSRPSLDE
ncbi:MAG: NnrS family protein [Nitrospirales bacterium]